MKGYIISIAVSAIIAATVNMIAPEKWKKYIGLVTGLVVVLCIGRPIFELAGTDVFSGFSFESRELSDEGEERFRTEIRQGLEERLEEDIKARVEREFGRECDAEVTAGMNDAGQITGVDRIVIYGRGFDNAVCGRLREVYGAKEAVLGGSEKVSRKTE